jgi:predicted transcriptional regulator
MATDELAGLHTRIPRDLKDRLDWILIVNGEKMMTVITEAVRGYVEAQEASGRIPADPRAKPAE